MRAYRVASGRTIAPFGDRARDLHIGVKTLSVWQEESARACGLDLVDVASPAEAAERPSLVFFDDVFFTEMALRQFVAAAMRGGREDLALAMPDSAILRAYAPLQQARSDGAGGAVFDVFLLHTSEMAASREALAERARPHPIDLREASRSVRLPPVLGTHSARDDATGHEASAPLTARIVANVRHWIHVLRLSQLSIGVTLLDDLRHHPRLALKLRMMRGRDPWEIARKVNFVHPTARVHPTADLECAVIGPGTVVQAHAHVHRSVLGANVEIGDHTAIMGSTLAEGVQVLRASYVALCAAMPNSTLGNHKVQLSLFGRDVFLTSSAALIDAKFRGEVLVEDEGALVSSGTPFLGACLGHRVTLGAHVMLQAGRVVPNGCTVVGPTEHVVSKVGEFPENTLLEVRGGKLVPR